MIDEASSIADQEGDHNLITAVKNTSSIEHPYSTSYILNENVVSQI